MIPDLNKVVAEALAAEAGDEDSSSTSSLKSPLLQTKVDNLSPVIEFLEGKNCLTGVSTDQIYIANKYIFISSTVDPMAISCNDFCRELAGGSMSFAMAATYANSMRIKMVKRL